YFDMGGPANRSYRRPRRDVDWTIIVSAGLVGRVVEIYSSAVTSKAMTIAPIVIGAAPAYLILLLFARDNLCSSSPLELLLGGAVGLFACDLDCHGADVTLGTRPYGDRNMTAHNKLGVILVLAPVRRRTSSARFDQMRRRHHGGPVGTSLRSASTNI